MKKQFIETTFRNVLLPVALIGFTASAHALTLSVDTEAYAPTGSTGVQQSNINATGSGSASAYSSDATADYNSSAYSRGFVRDDGVMGAGADGSGESYTSWSGISWADSYTNTSLTAEDIAFDFLIWGGSLGTYGVNAAGESASASYWIDILVNGTSAWSSSATLTTTSGGSAVTEAGTSLGGTLSTWSGDGGNYFWTDTTASLDLGTLDVGETLTLEYIMGTSATGIGVMDTGTNCYGEEGEFLDSDGGFQEEEGYFGCGGVSSYTGIGDPFGFSASAPLAPTISGTAVASVPEPETFLLLGAGAFAMTFVSRRRKKLTAKK